MTCAECLYMQLCMTHSQFRGLRNPLNCRLMFDQLETGVFLNW